MTLQHGGHTDQGLLYSYLKYNLKSMTQIFNKKIVNFGPGPNGSTIVESHIHVEVATDNPFWNISKRIYPFSPKSTIKIAWALGPNPGLMPPYRDHAHYTGESKPWKFKEPVDLWDDKVPPTDMHVWWRTVDQLRKEGVNIQFDEGQKEYVWRRGK
jgi:hypothetical protein